MSFLKRWIGTRQFYKKVFLLVLPIIVQNFITQFVSMIDNMMIGQTGTLSMTGVSISNQLIYVFNLTIFGAVSGAGIFASQYFGSQNYKGVKQAFWFKCGLCFLISIVALLLFMGLDEFLIGFWINDGDPNDLAQTIYYAKTYLHWMCLGLLPIALSQVLSSTLRECSKTLPGMQAGLAAIIVNVILNYFLIFGKAGFPALGAQGAAIATVISRFVEAGWLLVYIQMHKKILPYMQHLREGLQIPWRLLGSFIIKTAPLMMNEMMWSMGIVFSSACYAFRGLDIVAAYNITSTMTNLFNITFISMGSAISIIIGQLLGAGQIEQAKQEDRWLIAFSVFVSLISGTLMYTTAPFFVSIYQTEPEIKEIANGLIRIAALLCWIHALNNGCYFTIRSGGKTGLTFVLDSGLTWLIYNPVAYILCHFTAFSIFTVYALVTLSDLVKALISVIMVRKGIWIHNLTTQDA
jgi:putative MATE family efflux protein